MKNIAILLTLLVAVSCIPIGDSKDKKQMKARTEKVGKVEIVKADIDKYRFEVNGQELKEAKVPYGCTVKFRMKGLEGFKVIEGKVQCIVSMSILDKNNVEVLGSADLFKDEYPNGLPEELFISEVTLSAKFQTPVKINETYKFTGKITDKNSEAKVTVTEDFLMIPTPGLLYEEKGITSAGPIMLNSMNYDLALSENERSLTDTIRVNFSDLGGLTEVDGKVNFNASYKIVNEFGDLLYENADILKEDFGKNGVATDQATSVRMSTKLSPLKSGKKYAILYSIIDKNDKSKSLTAKYDFTIK